MTKRIYSQPKLLRGEVPVFDTPAPASREDDASIRNLRPYYLVHRNRTVAIEAVRFKFESDKEYRHWQAVSTKPFPDLNLPQGAEVPDWILLGFVPVEVRFTAQVCFLDAHGSAWIASASDLIARAHRSYELSLL